MTNIFNIKTLLVVLLCFWLFNSFISIGSYVEQKFFPVRINQYNGNVQFFKGSRYFCWDYFNTKIRNKTAITTIVKLIDQDNPKGYLFTPFKRPTLTPWNLGTDIAPSTLEQPFCIYVPPGFSPKPPFKIDQVFVYHGFMGLWDIITQVPPIEFDERSIQYEHPDP